MVSKISKSFNYFTQMAYKFFAILNIRTEGEVKQAILFGIFGVINFPTFYFVWHDLSPQRYDSLTLRLVATFLCLLLALRNLWPPRLKPFFGVFWYASLVYCLSFFGTYMLLRNHGSPMWVTNAMLVLMLLTILLDWLSFTIVLLLGILIAILVYILQTHDVIMLMDYLGISATYFSAIVIASIFTYGRDKVEKAKFDAIKSVGASIAHELRTPLLSIDGGITGFKQYFPLFIETYELAKKSGLAIPKIRTDMYESLLTTLDDMGEEIRYSNTIVDMLLMKVRKNLIKSDDVKVHSIDACIDETLRRYPFASEDQRKLIHIDHAYDFEFKGNQLLVVHILFNLLKNALYFIEDAKKGEIYLWKSSVKEKNRLHFKDTGKGISPQTQLRLFESFFSTTRNGTGLGLAFCKMVMNSLKGDIICYSKEGEYAEFILIFPKI